MARFAMNLTQFPLPAAYENLEPAAVWKQFAALNAIPRPSGAEAAARAYVQQLAAARQARWDVDARGNLVVQLPASDASSGAPTVVLQSHLDMVCQQRPGVDHDFDIDPIVPRREGDKIYATGTTLGADNGLGAAMMMAILAEDNLQHPALELLFTVEEETGLFGAAELEPELLKGRLMINLDSEDPDEITIGCAGGAGTSLILPLTREALADSSRWQIVVGGLAGGHSGVEIAKPLGNAIKILVEVVNAARIEALDLRLIEIEGGTAHNAIPRDATSHIAVPDAQKADFERAFDARAAEIKAEWKHDEPDLTISVAPSHSISLPINAAGSATILELLRALPHGVAAMSARYEGKVQTSSNLAEVETREHELEVHVSNRSFLASDIANLQATEANLGEAAGAQIMVREGYPGWEPRDESPLREKTIAVYRRVMGREPLVEVVHAGLECGLLSEKFPGLDAISFGPLIKGAHTPEEWTSIQSTGEIWEILTALLEDLA